MQIQNKTFRFLMFLIILGAACWYLTIKLIIGWIGTLTPGHLIGGLCVIGICIISSIYYVIVCQRRKEDFLKLTDDKNRWL